MSSSRTTAFCAIFTVAFSACAKDVASPPPATLNGTVVVFDAWGNRLNDFSGVDIAVDGFSAHATTDASGAWTLDGVPSGKHDLTFTKADYATIHDLRLSVAAPSTDAGLTTLAQAPFQQALIDSVRVVTQSGADVYLVDGHLSAPPPANAKLGGTVALFGSTNRVSTDIATFVVWANGTDRTGKSSTFSISLPASVVRAAFSPSDHVYVAAYAISAICGCYYDALTSRPIFATAGPRSNVVSAEVK
jgi:hypothetical protein